MNKYELTTEKKKKSIINAALTLFTDKGFSSVSIKEIAALAHVSQVSIYNYFGSKEALVAESVNIVMSDTLQQAADILAQDISFTEKIKLALLLCTEKMDLSISDFFTEEALNDPALVELLTRDMSESKNRIFQEYIELGQQEKVIDSTIPTETLLDFMEAFNIMDSRSKFDDETSSEKIKHIHHLLLYGIIGK